MALDFCTLRRSSLVPHMIATQTIFYPFLVNGILKTAYKVDEEAEIKTTINKSSFDYNKNKGSLSKKELECSLCKRVFISKSHLDKHYQFVHVHNGKNVFQCSICENASKKSTIGTKDVLNKHMAEIHSEEKEGYIISVLDSKYQCLFCDSEFSNKTEVNRHIYSQHVTLLENGQNVDSYCIYCNSTFQDLDRHINGIHNMKREIPIIVEYYQGRNSVYKCSLCNFKDVSKYSFAYHITSVH